MRKAVAIISAGKWEVYDLPSHVALALLGCGLFPSCRWGYKFPNAKVNLALKWETRSRLDLRQRSLHLQFPTSSRIRPLTRIQDPVQHTLPDLIE
ncbi:hypothetical protein GQ55_3G034100 [Panicum hallii var. hallii]|uniref:Uncharacterized protein n=2 Tax=Panicum hallii TaxID=206008 RepID=A0A2T7E5A7_9POAL|nr:hypothetical protein PAHAL_3G031800 [Panicum hallii]PUZ63018.1 hypothetical protein GQ55_3G034100 [Panicum hallii var. hallii]